MKRKEQADKRKVTFARPHIKILPRLTFSQLRGYEHEDRVSRYCCVRPYSGDQRSRAVITDTLFG